jgi:citrate lyase alpha subunit
MKTPQAKVKQRPAESASVVAGAVVVLAAKAFHCDESVAAALSVIVVALVAPVTTFIVEKAKKT